MTSPFSANPRGSCRFLSMRVCRDSGPSTSPWSLSFQGISVFHHLSCPQDTAQPALHSERKPTSLEGRGSDPLCACQWGHRSRKAGLLRKRSGPAEPCPGAGSALTGSLHSSRPGLLPGLPAITSRSGVWEGQHTAAGHRVHLKGSHTAHWWGHPLQPCSSPARNGTRLALSLPLPVWATKVGA